MYIASLQEQLVPDPIAVMQNKSATDFRSLVSFDLWTCRKATFHWLLSNLGANSYSVAVALDKPGYRAGSDRLNARVIRHADIRVLGT
jgi:hypothetical protein